MRVCAGIVVFHPDMERLRKCIDAVLPQVDKVYLVNNAPEDAEALGEALAKVGGGVVDGNGVVDGCGRVVKIDNDENLGIAAALNQLMTAAVNDGFEWILTLDQDSICSEGLVEALAAVALEHSSGSGSDFGSDSGSGGGKVAMVSPRIIDRGEVWEDGKTGVREDVCQENRPLDTVEFCITSGTLTSIEAVRSVGGFDERLFIDEVDREICIRLRRQGFRLLRVNTAELAHEFGEELVSRRVFFKVYRYRNYSPFRVYYQIRNLVYMVRKYGADYKTYPAWRLIRPFFTFFVKFIFEPQRLARLSAFVKGYCAGLVMKLEV